MIFAFGLCDLTKNQSYDMSQVGNVRRKIGVPDKKPLQIGVRGQKSLGNGAADRGALARTFK